MVKRLVAWFAVLGVVAVAALLVLSFWRYGGPRGLIARAQTRLGASRPDSVFVPTPLPSPTLGAESTQEPQATVAPSPTHTATAEPTPTDPEVPTNTPTSEPTPAFQPAQPAVELTGFVHIYQTWNNCAPATLAMALSHYGSPLTQEDIGAVLRPDWDDKHVGTDELAAYARSQGFIALDRSNGNEEQLKLFLSNGIPVVLATWHEEKPNDGMGHYRLVVGYDDVARQWLLYDSLAGSNADRNAPYQPLRMSYDQLAAWWKVFNHRYLLVYQEPQDATVKAILGADVDDGAMWQRALADAEAATVATPNDPFAWFNLGTNLLAAGRPAEAASAYDHARVLGLPWRMLWYQSEPFRAYYEAGRHDEVIALANATQGVTPKIEETFYWEGMALAAQGDVAGARANFQQALALRPSFAAPAAALQGLE